MIANSVFSHGSFYTCESTTAYLHNSLLFPSHSVTRSSDSLDRFLSISCVPDSEIGCSLVNQTDFAPMICGSPHLYYIPTGACVNAVLFTYSLTRIPGLPGLPGSIRRLHCHGWPSAGEKSLKLINTPSHSPNDGQASPCLNSHSTHIPIFIACSILCLSLPHHCPIHAPNPQISDLSFRSWQVWVHAFP